MMQCCVCSSQLELEKCGNPRCRNHVCVRHRVTFELSDETGTTFDYFCSRECWRIVQRRALPLEKEIWIALVVVISGLLGYLLLLIIATN